MESVNNKYILHCLFNEDISRFHKHVVDFIAENTGLKTTKVQGLPAHFTLKYSFTTDDIVTFEEGLATFAQNQTAAPVKIGELSHFNRQVIFFNVHLSKPALAIFLSLTQSLKKHSWMKWDQYDGENLHFHMTVAENCGSNFEKAWKLAETKAQQFETFFDNVTLLKETGVNDGIDLWSVYRTFKFNNSK
jgi:2'-5' RNA ligase